MKICDKTDELPELQTKGQHVGYIRVSTVEQNTARQLDGVRLDRVFEDRASGKSTDRPGLSECLKYIRQGDVLHVHSMDRLARNLRDLRGIVDSLIERGITVRFEKEALEFSPSGASPMSQLLLSMLGAVAEFERSMILERQKEGIAKAKEKGVYKGRKPALDDEKLAVLRAKIADGVPKARAARELGISRATVYLYLGERENGRL